MDFFKKNSFLVKKINREKCVSEIKKIFKNNFITNSFLLFQDLKIENYIVEKILTNEKELKKKLCSFFIKSIN